MQKEEPQVGGSVRCLCRAEEKKKLDRKVRGVNFSWRNAEYKMLCGTGKQREREKKIGRERECE